MFTLWNRRDGGMVVGGGMVEARRDVYFMEYIIPCYLIYLLATQIA